MGLDNPLDLDQDRRCRSLAAVQNTAAEDPRRACCGDTGRQEHHRLSPERRAESSHRGTEQRRRRQEIPQIQCHFTGTIVGFFVVGESHLWDVVLRSLRGGERHGRHGHHDGLVGWVDGCRGSLRAGPYGGSVGGDSGPRRLHLSPLEKLEATRERNSKRYISFKKRSEKRCVGRGEGGLSP